MSKSKAEKAAVRVPFAEQTLPTRKSKKKITFLIEETLKSPQEAATPSQEEPTPHKKKPEETTGTAGARESRKKGTLRMGGRQF